MLEWCFFKILAWATHLLGFILFSCSTVSSSLQPHGLQHARHPCPLHLPELAQSHVHWVGDAIQPSHPLLLLPLSFPTSGSFPESVLLIRWPKYWRFSFSIKPSNEYSGLISFRLDWFDLLAVQGTVRSLLFSNTTVQNHQIFSPQPSLWYSSQHLYMTIGKNMITLTRWTFTRKVMSLLF